MHETLVLVISQALGGSKSSDGPKADPATAPRTADELETRLNRILG
jgi:hypothetical protein